MERLKSLADAYKQGRYDMQMDIYVKLLEFQEENGNPYTQNFLTDIINEILNLN